MKAGITLIILTAVLILSGCSESNDDSDAPKPVAKLMGIRL